MTAKPPTPTDAMVEAAASTLGWWYSPERKSELMEIARRALTAALQHQEPGGTDDVADWLWYGVDDDGDRHISFGRWQSHVCQRRYKLAEIQPTEHDHPATPPAPSALDRAVEALEFAKRRLSVESEDYRPLTSCEHDLTLYIDAALSAIRGNGGGT